MQNENDLIKKLMVSKQIMDRHNNISRGGLPSTPMLESYEPVDATVNIPQEYLSELPAKQQVPVNHEMNETKIMSSKLPDEIKRLMIEHPINQPNSMGGPTLSNDLVEKASRLMGNTQKPQVQESSRQPQTQQPSSLEMLGLKEMIRETIREVLSENGLLVESNSKTDEQFNFKVGKHIFEGKVTKIKKLK
jgi:hypothetical protein